MIFKRILAAASAALMASVIAASAVVINGVDTRGQNQIVSVGYYQVSVSNGLTAFSGGGQASATLMNSAVNRFTTVAVANDSARLPNCAQTASPTGVAVGVGTRMTVFNTTANSMNVFPAVGELINLQSANAAIAIATVTNKEFICVAPGVWQTNGGTT